ncbi:GNAT family N-acetyltransferase [Parachitinimonas caeni]|uniref:GNAT family N-acetyltransferase n=1 Tax=Parachitinimonas caeni TaxID=3031301 RepID=A0ABT7DZN3_9NEIS|nr:GNAT family N-acetyltransferase [Parachitinimonas caeni]MDK2125501.1 GNAT family N-acetyltransferase [Parachitinimonas caeni]
MSMMRVIDPSQYSISIMSADELATAVDWAKAEGWDPGLRDVLGFYKADTTGFLAGKYANQMVATISAVKYGAGFGFIGLYIVRNEFRGRGLGFKLWEAAIASLAGRNIGLDGVLAQQDNYKKSGFKLAHRNIRYSGRANKCTVSSKILPVMGVDMENLLQYDSQFFPDERRAFISNWFAPENTQTLVAVEGARIVGYGSIRESHQGFKIGPLNAENSEIAEALFMALSSVVSDRSEVFLDVPEPNASAIRLAEKFGMQPVFETARMYTKAFPDMPLEKIYGITSFELG